jgi:AcrR family transcriptional regulator
MEDTDGRKLRRTENRRAVVEALADLYADGNLDPSAADIADRAGLSPRSLFRYFDDVDDLARAAIDLQLERAAPFWRVDAEVEDDLDVRIKALVKARASLWERVAPGARAMRLKLWRNPVIAARLQRNRNELRDDVRRLLGDAPAEVLAAADVLCSFESWELLRQHQRLSRTRAEAVLVDSLHRLVGE